MKILQWPLAAYFAISLLQPLPAFSTPSLSNAVHEPLNFCKALLRSRLRSEDDRVQKISVKDGKSGQRAVKYLLPKGTPPKKGWPVVFIFQGSFWPVKFFRNADEVSEIYYEAQTIQELLKAGFAVVAPRALAGLAWQTNAPYFKNNYEDSSDFQMMKNLIKEIKKGALGPLNSQQLFATGISSGGYNTSRMAIAFPGKFKALAVHSASYATCMGPICDIPEQLSKMHPPTLILAGEKDKVVNPKTSIAYYEALERNNIATAMYLDPQTGHGWFARSPQLIVEWFLSFK